MGHALVKRNDKYAVFSSIVDAFITGWMSKEEYTDYIKEEYGRQGVRQINFDRVHKVEDHILDITLNRTRDEAIAHLMEMEIGDEVECNRLIDLHGSSMSEEE